MIIGPWIDFEKPNIFYFCHCDIINLEELDELSIESVVSWHKHLCELRLTWAFFQHAKNLEILLGHAAIFSEWMRLD